MAQKLFDKATLVTIPSQYKEGKIYNIKPEDQSSAFEFERGSAATRVNEDGLIEQAGVSNTQLWNDNNVVTSGTGSYANGIVTFTASTGNDYVLFQNLEDVQAYDYYEISFEAVINSGTFVVLQGTGNNFLPNYLISESGSYSRIVQYTHGAPSKIYFYSGNSLNVGIQFDGTISNISIKKVNIDTPRIDYTNGKSLLLEPQRKNELTYSSDLSIDKQEVGVSLVKDQTGPDGSSNGYTLIEDSNTSEHYIILDATATATNQQLTSSIFIKPNGRNKIQLWNYYLSNQFARVDIDLSTNTTSNGTASNMTFDNATVEDYPNGWKRVSITSTKSSSTYFYKIRVNLLDDNGNASYQGNGTGGLILFGQQIELASYPTSYIPTNGQTETRLADVCQGGGDESTFNDSVGTLYGEFDIVQSGITNGLMFVSDGSFSNLIMLRFNPIHKFQVEGTGGINILDPTARSNGKYKVALTYGSKSALFVNGTKVIEAINVFSGTGLSECGIGSSPYGNGEYNTCRIFAYFPEVLTDTELQQLTSNT